MKFPSAVLALAFILAFAVQPASAWSNKEHIQLTRIAALRLIESKDTPQAMKQWLRAAVPDLKDMAAERDYFMHARVGIYPINAQGLAFWATVPDLDAGSSSGNRPEKPYPVPARQLHFIDLEFYNADESKRVYKDDLSNKSKLEDISRDFSDERHKRAGMLPFRVEECYKQLVENLKANRLSDKPGQFPRDEHATKWAGFLAHYVEDNTQPQHSTEDYQSESYFPDKRKAPKVHAWMEYRLVDDDKDDFPAVREAMWAQFTQALDETKDPIKTDDVWQATIEVAMTSYDALPMIGRAAVAARQPGEDGKPDDLKGETFANFKGKYLGKEMTISEMKAHQLAWAVKRVERVWVQAWNEAYPK
jgi:hypothetical protein